MVEPTLRRSVLCTLVIVTLVGGLSPPSAASETHGWMETEYELAMSASVEPLPSVGLILFPQDDAQCRYTNEFREPLTIGGAVFADCFSAASFEVRGNDLLWGEHVALRSSGCSGSLCHAVAPLCGPHALETPFDVQTVLVGVLLLHIGLDLDVCGGSSGSVRLDFYCSEANKQYCR